MASRTPTVIETTTCRRLRRCPKNWTKSVDRNLTRCTRWAGHSPALLHLRDGHGTRNSERLPLLSVINKDGPNGYNLRFSDF
jgi:hypothetical protein